MDHIQNPFFPLLFLEFFPLLFRCYNYFFHLAQKGSINKPILLIFFFSFLYYYILCILWIRLSMLYFIFFARPLFSSLLCHFAILPMFILCFIYDLILHLISFPFLLLFHVCSFTMFSSHYFHRDEAHWLLYFIYLLKFCIANFDYFHLCYLSFHLCTYVI